MQNFEFKRGSTLELLVTLTDSLDTPMTINPADMRAEVRDSTTLLAVLDIAVTANPGEYLLTSKTDTSAWGFGVVYIDIRITTNGLTAPVCIYEPILVPDHFYWQTRIYYGNSATDAGRLLVGSTVISSTGDKYTILGYCADGVDLSQNQAMDDPAQNGSLVPHEDGMITYLVDEYPDFVTPVEDTGYTSQLVVAPRVVYSETLSLSIVQQITRPEPVIVI